MLPPASVAEPSEAPCLEAFAGGLPATRGRVPPAVADEEGQAEEGEDADAGADPERPGVESEGQLVPSGGERETLQGVVHDVDALLVAVDPRFPARVGRLGQDEKRRLPRVGEELDPALAGVDDVHGRPGIGSAAVEERNVPLEERMPGRVERLAIRQDRRPDGVDDLALREGPGLRNEPRSRARAAVLVERARAERPEETEPVSSRVHAPDGVEGPRLVVPQRDLAEDQGRGGRGFEPHREGTDVEALSETRLAEVEAGLVRLSRTLLLHRRLPDAGLRVPNRGL